MDKKIIKNYLDNAFLNEDITPGISVTNQVKKQSAKANKDGVKAIEKDVTSSEKKAKADINANQMPPNKYNYNGEFETEYHNEMETLNGQEMIQYDRTPDSRFSERALEAIEGSSKMGNNPEWANVVPKQQGFIGPEFGKELANRIKNSAKKRGQQTPAISLRGKDIQELPTDMVDNGHKPYAIEENKMSEADIKKGKFTSWCKSNGFDGPSKSCAEKAMSSDDTSAHKMATFYMNTVQPKGKTMADITEMAAAPKKPISDKNKMVLANWLEKYGSNESAIKLIDALSQTNMVSSFPDTIEYGTAVNAVAKLLDKKDFDSAYHKAKSAAIRLEKKAMKDSGFYENKNNEKSQIKESMKRLKFKNPFNGLGNALKLIPEGYKVDNKEFEMTDGNESYKIRWEGTVTEGKAVVLLASDKKLVNEDIQRMKSLFGYKSQDTLGLLKGKERLDENKIFSNIWDKTKTLMTETEDMDGADAKEGNWDEETKKASEATKHVKGSVSKDKTIAKGKEGNPDKAVSQAPEAKKPMKSSTGKNIESEATAKEGNWEDADISQAPEAKKHIHLKETYMDEEMDEEMNEEELMEKFSAFEENFMEGYIEEGDEIDSEEEYEADETFDDESEEEDEEEKSHEEEDEEEDEEGEPSSSELAASDDLKNDSMVKQSSIKLLFSQSSGEYWIDNNGRKVKVPSNYYDIASDKNKKGSDKAALILSKMEKDAEEEEYLD